MAALWGFDVVSGEEYMLHSHLKVVFEDIVQ